MVVYMGLYTKYIVYGIYWNRAEVSRAQHVNTGCAAVRSKCAASYSKVHTHRELCGSVWKCIVAYRRLWKVWEGYLPNWDRMRETGSVERMPS